MSVIRQLFVTVMARYSGSPTVRRAMKGPRMVGGSTGSPDGWKREVLTTLHAIQEVRQHCASSELLTVRYARKAGLSWTEIAAALGVTRQSAWERWPLSAVDARLRDQPLSALDPYWQDISTSYLEYVMTQLQRSLGAAAPHEADSLRLLAPRRTRLPDVNLADVKLANAPVSHSAATRTHQSDYRT